MAVAFRQLMLLMPVAVMAYTPKRMYMNEICGKNYRLFESSILRYSYKEKEHFPGNLSCSLILHGVDKMVQVRFLSIDTPEDSDCQKVRLTISDYDSKQPLTRLSGLPDECYMQINTQSGVCGRKAVDTLYRTNRTGDQVIFILSTNNTNNEYGNFEVQLTAFTQSVSGSCGSDFACNNGICISNQLACNGYNECGDNSDEVNGCILKVGTIVGIIFGVIVLFVLLIIIGWWSSRRSDYVRFIDLRYP